MKAGKKVYANVKYLGMIVFYNTFLAFLQKTPPPPNFHQQLTG